MAIIIKLFTIDGADLLSAGGAPMERDVREVRLECGWQRGEPGMVPAFVVTGTTYRGQACAQCGRLISEHGVNRADLAKVCYLYVGTLDEDVPGATALMLVYDRRRDELEVRVASTGIVVATLRDGFLGAASVQLTPLLLGNLAARTRDAAARGRSLAPPVERE